VTERDFWEKRAPGQISSVRKLLLKQRERERKGIAHFPLAASGVEQGILPEKKVH